MAWEVGVIRLKSLPIKYQIRAVFHLEICPSTAPQLDSLLRLPDGSLPLCRNQAVIVIDVEVLGGQHAATSSQMDERAVQWFDPQEGI